MFKQGTLGCTLALAGALYASSGRAEDHYYDHKHPGQIIQNQVVIHTSTNSTYFSLLGNAFGYGGVQQGSSKRNYIFSFWDQQKEKTLLLAYAPNLDVDRIGRFGDNVNLEGTGFQLLFYLPWQEEQTIRMAYRASLDSDANYLRISGFYRHDDDAWQYAGTFRVRTNGAWLSGSYGFVENFGGVSGPRKVSYSNHWLYDANGTWEESLSGSVNPQNEAVVSPESGGILVEYGTPTQKNGDALHWTTAPGNRMIPIPYQVDCGRDSVVTIDSDAEGLAHLVDDIGTFEVDGYYTEGQNAPLIDAVDVAGVADAAPASIYRSARSADTFSYTLGGLTPSADHVLRLHFAEPSASQAGQRTFDVVVNGTAEASAVDVFARAGGAKKAFVLSLAVQTDAQGRVNVALRKSTSSALPALLSGLELSEGKLDTPSGADAGAATDAGADPNVDAGPHDALDASAVHDDHGDAGATRSAPDGSSHGGNAGADGSIARSHHDHGCSLDPSRTEEGSRGWSAVAAVMGLIVTRRVRRRRSRGGDVA